MEDFKNHYNFESRTWEGKIVKFKLAFVLVFFSLLMVSCHHRYPVVLVEADSLLYSNPQKALAKLDSVGSCMDTTNVKDMMYFRLVRMLARDRMGAMVNDGVQILEILKYYQENKDQSLLPKAYYLQGRNMQQLHDSPQALIYYNKVLELTGEKRNRDVLLRALTFTQMGYILYEQENFQKALNSFKKALSCYRLKEDDSGMLYSLRDIAVAYDFLNMRDSAMIEYQKALSLANSMKVDSLVLDIKLQMANYYLGDESSLDSIKSYMMPLLYSNNSQIRSKATYEGSLYYQIVNNKDSTLFFLESLLNEGDEYQKQDAALRMMNLMASNPDSVQKYYNIYLDYTDSVNDLDKRKAVEKYLALYDYTVHEEKANELQKTNERIRHEKYIFFALLAIVLLIFVIYYQMGIVKKLRIRNKINELKLFSLSSDTKYVNKQNEIKKHLCLNRYIEERKLLTDEDWKALDLEVNQLYHNFKEILNCGVKLSDFEYRVCLLVKIGVETKNIALFTAHSKQAVSMAKQRLFSKITKEKGRAEDFDLLIANL